MAETTEERTYRLNRDRGNGVEANQFGVARQHEQSATLLRPSAAPLLAGAPAPLCSPQGLTHVGTLNAEHKSGQMNSYEGQGLSVSQHPEAWKRIARLGNTPTWNVGRADAQFLDYHELTPEQRVAIDDWGVESGYIELQPAFKISTWNDEVEDFQWHVTLSAEEAEAERQEAIEYDSGTLVEDCVAAVSTAAFPDPTVHAGATDVEQILATLWVAECAPELDGVWWEDIYDPDGLSAPRGVLVMAKIDEWVASATPRGADDDDFDEDE